MRLSFCFTYVGLGRFGVLGSSLFTAAASRHVAGMVRWFCRQRTGQSQHEDGKQKVFADRQFSRPNRVLRPTVR